MQGAVRTSRMKKQPNEKAAMEIKIQKLQHS
jgi:hypothetical protein